MKKNAPYIGVATAALLVTLVSMPKQAVADARADFRAMSKALAKKMATSKMVLKPQDGQPKVYELRNGQLHATVVLKGTGSAPTISQGSNGVMVKVGEGSSSGGAQNRMTVTNGPNGPVYTINGKVVTAEEGQAVLKGLGASVSFFDNFSTNEEAYSGFAYGASKDTIVLTPKGQSSIRYAVKLGDGNLPKEITCMPKSGAAKKATVTYAGVLTRVSN